MERKQSIQVSLLLAFLILITLGCSSKKEDDDAPINEEEIVTIDDPFYAVLTEESSLEDYWELFKADAIRSGKVDPSLNRTVNLFFGNEPDFASGITADHAGRAYSICNDEVVSFEIIESFWEDFTIVQRLYTFYHEAGHARYNYRHPCEANEVCNITDEDLPIMWRSVESGNVTLEEFKSDKDNFFARRWEGVRYFDCN